MKEQQIHPKPGRTNTQPSLTADKCEIAPEFKQEVSRVGERVRPPTETPNTRLSSRGTQGRRDPHDGFLRCHEVGRQRFARPSSTIWTLIFREHRARTEPATDLAVKLAHAPSVRATPPLRRKASLLNRPGAAHEMNVVRRGKREGSCDWIFEVRIPNHRFGISSARLRRPISESVIRKSCWTGRSGKTRRINSMIVHPKPPPELTG